MTRAKGQAAVMAQCGPKVIEGDDPVTARNRKLEFFPTWPWATRAGAELVKFLDPRAREVLDPCCGEGHMAMVLTEYFASVRASDVYDYGYGSSRDYLDPNRRGVNACDWVIMNPPFEPAAEFIRRALLEARRGVAVFARLAFLESEARYSLLWRGEHPLSHVACFVERVPLVLGRLDPVARSATAYAWFFFDKEWPQLRAPELMAIPPGTKRRLTKPDDARRFVRSGPAPLFHEIDRVARESAVDRQRDQDTRENDSSRVSASSVVRA